MIKRVCWHADLVNVVDEPLALSLIKYDMARDRWPHPNGNLVSSHLEGSVKHAPILDLDIPHHYVRSTSDGHGHLYIDVPMSKTMMMIMMFVLWRAGVIEMGNFWWSLRRGGSFVRREGIPKTKAESGHYTYGMFFKLGFFKRLFGGGHESC